jgi:hypothetical protein
MDKEQWDLLQTGEQAFWTAVPHLLAAGYHTAEELTEPRRPSTGRPYKIPLHPQRVRAPPVADSHKTETGGARRMQQPRRLDGRQLIPAGTRNNRVGA